MLLADAFAKYLHDRGIVQYRRDGLPGGNTFLCLLPDEPDVAVMVEPMGGAIASGVHGYDQPVLHLLVRGTRDPRTGMALAQAIYDASQGLHHTTLPGGVYVVSCRGIQSGPVAIGPDENGRLRFSINLQFEIRNLTEYRE